MATKKPATGNRLRKDDAPEVRGDRNATADDPRGNATTAYDDPEYLELIRNEFNQETLPQLPAPSGWHYCWLPINSSYDPIHRRMRIGYIPVKFDELNDERLKDFKVTSGENSGCVQCNEMLLFKIEDTKYQMIMRELHHHAPQREEANIKSRAIDESKRDKAGKQLIMRTDDDEGFDALGAETPPITPATRTPVQFG